MRKRWGKYQILSQGKKHKVKLLFVNPHSATSLQKHALRTEIWIDIKTGKIEVIGKDEWHKIDNRTDKVWVILEVQLGKCLEKDIVRFNSKKESDGKVH